MGGPKTNTTQAQQSTGTTTNTFGQISPLDDPRYAEAVGRMGGFQFEADPRLPYTFARARKKVEGSYDNPTGAFTTPGIKDASLRASYEDIGQEEAQAYREENQGRSMMKYGQLADVAQMSSPRTVQTSGSTTSSGTNTGTSQTNPGALDTIMRGASLGLMAF